MGQDDYLGQNNGAQARVPLDAAQEFQVLTGQFDAEFGRTSGATVNAVIKSGTNKIHGSAFEFFYNKGTRALDFFQQNNLPKADTQKHEFGGSVGGPIVKDQVHFTEGLAGHCKPFCRVRRKSFATAALPDRRSSAMRIVGLNRFLLAACFVSLLAVGAAAQHAHTPPGQPPASLVDAVRQATERFRDVNQTSGANYFPFLGCVAGAQEGAMGVHFVNMSLLNDLGKVLPDQPEALIYEPRHGKFRLVGVEYIVPVEDWKNNNPPDIGNFPPVLNGQTFQFVDFPNRFGIPAFYELHVWAWQDNPKGTFADWNTLVSCDGATDGEEQPWQ